MTTPFTFTTQFQRAVLRLMMVDEVFLAKVTAWVEPAHFTADALGWLYKYLRDFWTTYHGRCTDLVLREACRQLPADKALRYAGEADAVCALGNVPEGEWVKAQLTEWVKQAVFAEHHQEAAGFFNAGKRTEAYDSMMRGMERVQELTFVRDDRIWLFDELPERQRQRVREQMEIGQRAFSTGLPQLDVLFDGGIRRTEVFAVMAEAKRCKSTWLLNMGFQCTRVHRQPVAHFIFEGTGRQISDRYDACFSEELYAHVKRGQIDANLYQRLYQEYLQLKGLLVLRTLNDWDITILDVERELKVLHAQGFDPAMIIVDYMDLGRARDRVDSETQHQLAFGRDLKRLVNRMELACWTAWQARRPRDERGSDEKKYVLHASSVADAYAKVRIVDGYGSLNATNTEMREGVMRLFWEGYRSGLVNKLWTITNDLSRMRMLTGAVEHDPAAAEGAPSP